MPTRREIVTAIFIPDISVDEFHPQPECFPKDRECVNLENFIMQQNAKPVYQNPLKVKVSRNPLRLSGDHFKFSTFSK